MNNKELGGILTDAFNRVIEEEEKKCSGAHEELNDAVNCKKCEAEIVS